MALETFDFPFHRCAVDYPDRGNRLTLGSGWDYTIKPSIPVSKTFKLSFPVMKDFPPEQILTAIETQYSITALEEFYLRHEMHEPFLYPSPRHGTLVVKFKTPLIIPSGIIDGDGAILNIETSLKEVSIS